MYIIYGISIENECRIECSHGYRIECSHGCRIECFLLVAFRSDELGPERLLETGGLGGFLVVLFDFGARFLSPQCLHHHGDGRNVGLGVDL